MLDPLTGFEYPGEWIAKCTSPEKLRLAGRGLAVLTSSGLVLRRGFTTGTTAAAAAKAAVLSLQTDTDSVSITLPSGIIINVPAHGHAGAGSSVKFAGDYPADVTAGLEFRAEAFRVAGSITVTFGEGIGRFSRDTPRYRKGMPAVAGQFSRSRMIPRYHEHIGVQRLQPGDVPIHLFDHRHLGVEISVLPPRVGLLHVEEEEIILGK